MIRIEVEVETNDPALRDYVLGDIESWRRTPAKVSVSLREEDAWTGGAKTVRVSTSTSMSTGAVAEETTEEEEPAPPRRIPPPQLVTVEAARQMVNFPVYVAPRLATNSVPEAMVQPGGTDIPPSVVVTHGVQDDRGHHRGNVWITSSPALLPASKFEAWRTIDGFDVCEDRSGGYYRCKLRTRMGHTGYVQVESTAHRALDDVLELMGRLDAG